MATQRIVVEWADVDLGWLRQAWCQVSGSTPAALLAALRAHTAAGDTVHVAGDLVVVNTAPPGGIYSGLDNLAQLRFCTAAGNQVQLLIPAPLAAIFYSGLKEVDQSAIADVIAAALGTLADTGGNPVTTYLGGSYLSRRKDQP